MHSPPFLPGLNSFLGLKYLVKSYCKQLGFSTDQWPKMAHTSSKLLQIVGTSATAQINDTKISSI